MPILASADRDKPSRSASRPGAGENRRVRVFEPPLFVFDGECGFCRRWASWLAQRAHPRIRFVEFQLLPLSRRHGLTEAQLRAASYLIDETGVAHGGAAGIGRVLGRCRGAWSGLGTFLGLPGIQALARVVYRMVALNRHRLPAPDEVEPLGRFEHECVAAILRAGDRVLLCHRHPDREWFPNVWDLPGGHRNPGELPSNALARELAEELGVPVDPPASPPFEVLLDEAESVELAVWLIEYNGPVENLARTEHDELRWVRSSDLPGLPLADKAYLPLLQRAISTPAAAD